jgi:hypothetical protein
MHILI